MIGINWFSPQFGQSLALFTRVPMLCLAMGGTYRQAVTY
jgi:hypothetical protein